MTKPDKFRAPPTPPRDKRFPFSVRYVNERKRAFVAISPPIYDYPDAVLLADAARAMMPGCAFVVIDMKDERVLYDSRKVLRLSDVEGQGRTPPDGAGEGGT